MNELSLYFHVPYCKQKCFYCDFNSYTNKASTIEEYFNCMNKELDLYNDKGCPQINSIFFGGGTPSFVDAKKIGSVLDKCSKMFSFSNNIEITIESNPDSLTVEKLSEYKKIGINRLSIGLQSWQDHLLKAIGRVHSKEQFINCYENARKTGFDNISVDLMFGLPNQTQKDWEETLESVLCLNPKHLSCYSLKLEEGTKLYDEYEKGMLSLPDEDAEREMYNTAQNMLKQKGFEQYEISNFALPGYESVHNLAYWTYKQYIGFGAGAHSFFDDTRTENIYNIEEYMKKINNLEFGYNSKYVIKKESQISEYIITGLRLNRGIDKEKFKLRFGLEIEQLYTKRVKEYIDYGLVIDNDAIIKLTDKGFDLSNTILSEFV